MQYNHAFDINIEMISNDENGEDLTGAAVKAAFLDHIQRIPDAIFLANCNLFDTLPIPEGETPPSTAYQVTP